MELAMVLVIVGLLLGGLLIPLSSQQDLQSRQATEKSLIDIREALIGFAVINGRLPCPAQANIAYTSTNAGIEATTGSGTNLTCACAATSSPGAAQIGTTPCSISAATDTVGGVLPWASLGLLETDAWGNRYTYHVSSFFARGIGQPYTAIFGCSVTTGTANAAFALCTPGGVTILTASGGTPLASQVPAAVVSHGKNGLGAYTPQGSKKTAGTGDEAENSNGDATFVSNTFIDDQLVWIPPGILMNRMIGAAKLP